MTLKKKNCPLAAKLLSAALAIPLLFTGMSAAAAEDAVRGQNASGKGPKVQLEYLDRGVVAAAASEGVFLSWRLKGDEVNGYSATGLTGVDFNVYRDGSKIATVTDSTNFLDRAGTAASSYEVSAVSEGRDIDRSAAVAPWTEGYYDMPLRKPADGVTPAGEAYTYSANDASVGDVDGDGRYELFVKWDPSNSKDVSQVGYTGNTYIDAYTLEGTLLYRIDLGVNIRSGAHYTPFMVYDFDGDGKAEMMFKTAPGTKVLRFDQNGGVVSENYITLPEEDIRAGYSNGDDYRMSRDDYYEHLVKMFMGWQAQEEVVSGRWPATIEESFGLEKRYEYPLSRANAETLVDYFMDTYAPSRSARNNLRAFEGFILNGPEYLTVFEGATGKELQTIRYKPGREDDGLMWGDYAMARIEPGNRVDRFLATVAYLDGKRPYAVFARGYYTRSTLVSYSWDGKRLKEEWYVDSGWVPMSNPFNDSPHGRDGTDPEYGTLTTQGIHSISSADVDGDGKQEIVYGAATIDHDGETRPWGRDACDGYRSEPAGARDFFGARRRRLGSVRLRDAGCRNRAGHFRRLYRQGYRTRHDRRHRSGAAGHGVVGGHSACAGGRPVECAGPADRQQGARHEHEHQVGGRHDDADRERRRERYAYPRRLEPGAAADG